jgi:hypothetical protein
MSRYAGMAAATAVILLFALGCIVYFTADIARAPASPHDASAIGEVRTSATPSALAPAGGELSYVYDYSVESAQDCTSHEQFDSSRGACYYTCSSESECDAIGQEIEAELSEWSGGQGPASAQPLQTIDPSSVVAVYQVLPGERISLISGTDLRVHHDTWQLFAAIQPDAYAGTYVTRYLLYNEPADLADASMENLGDGRWELAVNVAGFENTSQYDRIYTLVHELAHVITFNPSQVDIYASPESCNYFFTGEGCARASSYFEEFVARFWPPQMIAEADAQDQDAEVPVVYTRYPDRFITEYAATNPGEDIAESFTAFVLTPAHERGTGVAAQKAAFFAAYPELSAVKADVNAATRY